MSNSPIIIDYNYLVFLFYAVYIQSLSTWTFFRAQAATVTMTTISSRDRPRASGQLAREPVSNLKASNQNASLHKSFESGLDVFGHVPFASSHRVASESNLTKAVSVSVRV